MSIFLAIVGLGFLIFVHEAGHFVASLSLGMRPRKFYVGFPPALWKMTRGGVEYGIGAIPLGGFVKIPGMHRPTPDDADAAFGRAVDEVPALSGPVARLRAALAEDDHAAAREALASVRELIGERELSEPAARSAERGLTDLEDALGPDAYWRAATWRRVVAIAAGPVANIVLALVLFTVLFMTTAGRVTSAIQTVVPDSPAATAGLEAGDRIVSINGARVEPEEISSTISGSNGDALTIVVLRDGRRVVIGPVEPERADGDRYRLGIVLRGEGLPLLSAVGESFRITGLVTKDVVATIGELVTGSGREDIASPVGIVQGSSDAAEQGTANFIWVLGLISLSIALLNLLPLLPLDGGHIVFAVLEGVRGRSVGRAVYERVSIVGIGLVMILFFIGLTNDINRLS